MAAQADLCLTRSEIPKIGFLVTRLIYCTVLKIMNDVLLDNVHYCNMYRNLKRKLHLQLKQAMVSVLDELNEGDRINIMTFSSSTSFWQTEMVEVTGPEVIEEAKVHVNSINPGGCKWLFLNVFFFFLLLFFLN